MPLFRSSLTCKPKVPGARCWNASWFEALNVKTALFFLAFLPQFVASGEPLVAQLVLLGSICVALNTLVDVVAVFAADRLLKSEIARSPRARLLTRVSGVTMLGLGAYLALARREV